MPPQLTPRRGRRLPRALGVRQPTAAERLGYRSRPLAEGLRATVEWLRRERLVPPQRASRGVAAVSLSRGELLRRLVHVGCVGFALLLRWLDAAAGGARSRSLRSSSTGRCCRASAGAGCGAPPTSRAATRSVSWSTRSRCSALILVFHDRLWMAAAGWGILAVGDGMASLVGQAVGGPRLPWNERKGWAGLVSFVLFGAAAAALPRGLDAAAAARLRRRALAAHARRRVGARARLRARRVAAHDARRQRHGARSRSCCCCRRSRPPSLSRSSPTRCCPAASRSASR